MKLTKTETQRMRWLAKNNLFFLARGILMYDHVSERPHAKLCRFLEGPERRKLVLMPRGFLKTTVATKADAIRESLQNPWTSQLLCAQIITNAMKMLDEIRSIWETNAALQALFPELLPTKDSTWNSLMACLNRPTTGGYRQQENTYEAAGIGTQLQSRHYDVLRADDLVVAKKDQTTGEWMAPSEDDIAKAVGWHQMTFGLMRNVREVKYYQIMTRWCPDDLYDYLTKEEPDSWTRFALAAIDSDGEPTFPTKYPLDVLEEIKTSQGPYKYSTQYLNLPAADELLTFRDTYTIYTHTEPLPKFRRIVAALDPAISQRSQAHPTGFVVCGITDTGERYVIDWFEEKLRPREILEKVFYSWKRFRFKTLGLETVAYQEALKDDFEELFHREGGRLFRIHGFTSGSIERKELRIAGLQPSFAAGWWFVRADMGRLRSELDHYPFGTIIDSLDALAYANQLLPPHHGSREAKDEVKAEDYLKVTYESLMKEFEAPSSDLFSRQRPPQFTEVSAFR